MNPSFGALVAYRRRSLGLTQAQLAYRMAAYGHAVDICALERGGADISRPETRTMLAIALEWPLALLEVVSGESSSVAIDGNASEAMGVGARDRDVMEVLQVIREELVVYRTLQRTLQQWLDDLERRVQTLLPKAHLQRRAVRFDD